MPRKPKPVPSVGRILDQKALEFIQESNYPHKEHLIIICSLIEDYTTIANNFKNLPQSRYVNISDDTIKELITKNLSRKKAKQFLLDNNIMECDGVSIKGEKSYGYRITEKYLSIPVIYFLTKPTIIKNIIKKRNRDYSALPVQFHSARNHFMNIKIDYTRANEYTNNLYLNDLQNEDYITVIKRYKYYFTSILKIKNGDLYFKKNRTNNRIDTNLTNLPSELRQFIEGDDELYNIDISCSQPFLFAMVLIQNKIVDIDYNRECVNGTVYEYYANAFNALYQTKMTRDEAKVIVMKVLFSENNIYKKEKDVFRMIFPQAYDFIYNSKKEDHKKLSNELQKLESSVILDNITMQLEELNIKYYTIHDSIVVKKEFVEQVADIISDTFINQYATKPNVKKEKLNKDEK